MNLGLITSYIIAGILLLSIIMMNMSVSSSSTEITMNQITRDKTAGISEMLSSDVNKIGYNRSDLTSQLLTIGEGKKIQFRSNIDNSSDNSVESVTWEFTNTAVTSTNNPNDYVLKRTVRDVSTGNIINESPIKLGVTKFNIAYYNKYGVPLSDSLSTPIASSDLDDIRQLYISLKVESPDKVFSTPNSDGHYVISIWEKRFSPPNLQF